VSGHFGACVNTGQFGAGLCKNCAHEEIQRLRTHNHALELGLRVAEERLAEAERDAARYRWLRRKVYWSDERDMGPGGQWWFGVDVKNGRPTLDDAIDAAMAGDKP
jgi:hypothetical protein